MIVIFASSYDQSADSLAEQWANYDASLLTCSDLSLAGWRHFLDSTADSTAVIGTKLVPVNDITGVLIRWPGVFAEELTQIIPDDRNYVAGEMMAFLVSWFLSLRCPVINRPTPLNLTGPAWRIEQWTNVAAKLGIPVRTVYRRVARDSNCEPVKNGHIEQTSVTVVGNDCFGTTDATLREQARSLAAAAGTSLLEMTFARDENRWFFTHANLVPDIDNEISEAVLELLNGRSNPSIS